MSTEGGALVALQNNGSEDRSINGFAETPLSFI